MSIFLKSSPCDSNGQLGLETCLMANYFLEHEDRNSKLIGWHRCSMPGFVQSPNFGCS